MAYNPFKLAARLRRLATKLENSARFIRGGIAILNIQGFDQYLDQLNQVVRELRHIADTIKKPAPPIH